MFRQIVIPTEKNHLITLPEDLYGKQVEVIAFELDRNKTTSANKRTSWLILMRFLTSHL